MPKKILIADDDEVLLILLNRSLTHAGYEVQCLNEASAIVNNMYEYPDLFILDKEMGFIDGLAVCKFLRLNKKGSEIPIVIISSTDTLKEKSVQAGANYFMAKPLDVDKLIEIIGQLVNN